ncbi:methyltransferase domain-containing protein [Altererythrobacter salegens]|uniref:Methyltransferase domain-containing protein n=1 Tax=Croceibacterium salegens TaxID=1737568 RepID=A0A6I4SZT6_9SPHN|nr:methyltransferase domain-containing protein [Croceibacterium salegens]MXO60740.1 methyltransferase domain-containing protein [Croceibacterium salegens]
MVTKVGQNIETANAAWNFGGNVPDHFVDHIRHSVPLYAEGHDLICQLSDYFVANNSTVYEIGVSTGELLKKVALRNQHRTGTNFIGMDVEEAMTAKARKHTADVPNIEILDDDARTYHFEKSDLILSYYTMQFIPPRDRQELFNKLYDALHWGGALIMFEKVRAPDARFQDIAVSLYNEFKLANGFNCEEIVTKTRSLKGVLEPFSTQGNLDLFERAGFKDVTTIAKYVCFEGFLAIK